jgi:SHS2 domain-containing protein
MTSDAIEEIEHTADWAIRVRAKNLSSLFEQTAKGMVDLIGQIEDTTDLITRPLTLQAADLETLLVSWLEELLFILETENLMLSSANVQLPSETQLLATIGLLPVKERWKEIKAVTYHDLEVQKTSEGFEVSIVFDV